MPSFPSTPTLLDDFNRANEDPISSPWTIVTGTPNCKIVSNEFALSTGTYGQAYYNGFSARDMEASAKISVFSSEFLFGFRMRDAAADSTKYGYEATALAATGRVYLKRKPPGASSVELINALQTVTSGDSIGVRAVGPALQVWYQVGAGAWTKILDYTDHTYVQPGRVILQLANTTGRWDNFGGGPVGGGWKRLAGPARLTAAADTVYTVPSGIRTVIRHIHAYNPGSGTANLTLAVGSDAASTRLFDAYPVSEDVPLDYGRKHVLAAGETIQASASVANQLVLTITGEELELVV